VPSALVKASKNLVIYVDLDRKHSKRITTNDNILVRVHKPPSIEVPLMIVDRLTSCTNSSDPGRSTLNRSAGMKILRDEKISPEIGGLESGNTLSILKRFKS